MIKLDKEGYYYISRSGRTYELWEGVSIGSPTQFTSDIIFITLYDLDLKIDSPFVGFFYGASFMGESLEEYDQIIEEMVNEYEERNKL